MKKCTWCQKEIRRKDAQIGVRMQTEAGPMIALWWHFECSRQDVIWRVAKDSSKLPPNAVMVVEARKQEGE